ncbi:MAG: AAA family ATPase [Gemmatimonadaceae bacterium]|nr:AAA family ATPase [Gemmatimonadaceae bacterium]
MDEHAEAAGLFVTALVPDLGTTVAASALIAAAIAAGENVAGMVPVECDVDDPCEAGSAGAQIRWAAGHLDDPRHVTPLAFAAPVGPLLAAQAAGVLPHLAALDRARAAMGEGRTLLVVCDAIGPLEPITPSVTLLDVAARWGLGTVAVVPVAPTAIGEARAIEALARAAGAPLAGVVLVPPTHRRGAAHGEPCAEWDADAADALRTTIGALLDRPVAVLAPVDDVHDRAVLREAAAAAGLGALVARARR